MWNGNPAKTTFTLDEDKVGVGNWGFAEYFPQLGATQGFITVGGGSGSATITAYDEANKRISGTFSFRGKYFDGANYKDSYQSFAGSFENVPIIDPNNPQLPCAVGGTPIGGIPGGGNTGGSTSTASVTYKNLTYTDINIIFNGSQKIITPANTATFSGNANAAFTATASTAGKTSGNTLVGLEIQWKLNGNFPASGTSNISLNAPPDYFFLKLINQSNKTINKIYTNYGLISQTAENLTIASDGKIYSLGYYKAFNNSNVRAESGTNYWSYNSLALPFTPNQSITVTANP